MGRMNLPWKLLREYFFRLSSTQSRSQLYHEAVTGVRDVICCDASGIFDSSDFHCFEGIGREESTGPYNEYYRTIMPSVCPFIVDWGKREDEFAVDFMRRYDMYTNLRHWIPEYKVHIWVQRSRWDHNFGEQDLQNVVFINNYLNDIYTSFEKKERSQDPGASAGELADRFKFLSPREAEVCSLVARRMSTAEIAASLFISHRTVEKHIESIFDKLDVRSREQLRWRLGATPIGQT